MRLSSHIMAMCLTVDFNLYEVTLRTKVDDSRHGENEMVQASITRQLKIPFLSVHPNRASGGWARRDQKERKSIAPHWRPGS
jgi:hypothetical protein